MESYSLKQLFGGFILLAIFITLFVINITIKSSINIKMLLNPILVSISICLLIYIISLNEHIKLKKKELTKIDNFVLKTCPTNFKQITEKTSDNKTNIKCDSVNEIFYLNGDDNTCLDNGCFNKYSSKKEKCKKIKDFFKSKDQNILKNWIEYNNECVY
jgi:hypothetical protein